MCSTIHSLRNYLSYFLSKPVEWCLPLKYCETFRLLQIHVKICTLQRGAALRFNTALSIPRHPLSNWSYYREDLTIDYGLLCSRTLDPIDDLIHRLDSNTSCLLGSLFRPCCLVDDNSIACSLVHCLGYSHFRLGVNH